MAKLKNKVLILGEGPTEFYYFKSLCDVLKGLVIQPDYPKHTSMKELGAKIVEGIDLGYSHIFCVVDMDTKMHEKEADEYRKLLQKYRKPINKPKKGIYCEVKFFETHLCTELFFLYYFKYTSKLYTEQGSLLRDLNKCCFYEKNVKFFSRCGGLHTHFQKNGGSLEKACSNSNNSLIEKIEEQRDYTYSDLGKMIEELKDLLK